MRHRTLPLLFALLSLIVPFAADAQQSDRTIDLGLPGKIVFLLILMGVFILTVVMTPRIWGRNKPREHKEAEPRNPR